MLYRPKLRFNLIASVCAVLTFASLTLAQTYTVTDIGTLGGKYSAAMSVNNYGEVVGHSATSNGEIHAFLYLRDGTLVDINTLGGTYSSAFLITNSGLLLGVSQTVKGQYRPFLSVLTNSLFDLGEHYRFSSALGANDEGQVVGCKVVSNEHGTHHKRAFLYTSRGIVDLGTFGGKQGDATAINNSGEVVGHLYTAYHDGYRRAVLYSSGKITELGTLGGKDSIGVAINDAGQVIGYAALRGGDQRAFIYTKGRMRSLGTLSGGTQSFAYGINNQGHVVGSSDAKDSGLRAVIYRDGAMYDLNESIPRSSGWLLTEARSINEKGQIVGYGSINGEQHAFLLTPVGPAQRRYTHD